MQNSRDNLFKIIALGLLSASLAGNAAQARPASFSKALTFTQTTTAPAPAAARSRNYFPANTKYSSVRLQRGGTDVAMESVDIAHEGVRAASQKPARAAR